MTIALYWCKMFTRVPTFIPTSPKNADEFVNTRYSRAPSQASKAKSKIHHQELLSRKRKKAKHSSRRRKKTGESSYDCQELPVSVSDDQDPTKVQESSGVTYPYETRRHTTLTAQWKTGIMEERESVIGVDMDQDILTLQPRLHKRHRQKGTEELSPYQGDNETRTSRNESSFRQKIKADDDTKVDIWGSRRLSRSQIGTSRAFRSKIPVRFPMIQEKTNYSKGHSSCERTGIPSLPPIQSEPSTGVVTRSILDYQNKLENDFKRLGENLDNTFKLLHRYIQQGRSTDNS